MDIRGLHKTSLIDYPGKICCTIFVGGCNLRCLYCYNKDLVLEPETLPFFPIDEVLTFLQKRISFLDGVCISGGEPTLQKDLPAFIGEIKNLGLSVKLDTNGMKPGMISRLLEDKMLDFIAIDIKAPFEKYNLVTGVRVDISTLKETINIVKNDVVEYEFRTTFVPDLLDKEDIIKIAQAVGGCRKFVLQRFLSSSDLIDCSFNVYEYLPPGDVTEAAYLCLEHVEAVDLRGF